MTKPTTAALVVGVIVGLAIGANTATPPTQRYQITASGDVLFVLDNQTNNISVVAQERVPNVRTPDWPWRTDRTFSLEKALAEKTSGH